MRVTNWIIARDNDGETRITFEGFMVANMDPETFERFTQECTAAYFRIRRNPDVKQDGETLTIGGTSGSH